MSERRLFEPNPDQPDRCPSMDPYDSGLQCTRLIHEDDHCHSGGIAWKKGTPRHLSEGEQAVAEVERRLHEVFGPVCAEPCEHAGCQAQHIAVDVRSALYPKLPGAQS